jgi:hypothetical protein
MIKVGGLSLRLDDLQSIHSVPIPYSLHIGSQILSHGTLVSFC